MKKAISVLFLFVVSFLALHAQDDYHIRQARSYQREAEYYTRRALSYEREAAYYNRQAQGYFREAG